MEKPRTKETQKGSREKNAPQTAPPVASGILRGNADRTGSGE